MANLQEEYEKWLVLRFQSADEDGQKLCYCGHTYKCECADPDVQLFKESVGRKTIKLGDPKNGWKKPECNNGILSNWIPCLDYTFARRLQAFMKDVQTNDMAGMEEREYIETIAERLLKWQRAQTTETWEIEYLERTEPPVQSPKTK